MSEGEPQRTIATHGDAADRPIVPALADPIFRFDERDEFVQEEITVAHRPISRINVERSPAFGRDDEKFSHLVLAAKIVEHRPSPAVKKSALVITEAVQKIQYGICLRGMLSSTGVVAGGKVDAVVNRMLQNLAAQRVAVDAALRVSRNGNNETSEQKDDSEPAIHSIQFTRSARLVRDRAGLRAQPGKGPQRGSRKKKTRARTLLATTVPTRNAPLEKTDS